MVDAVLDGTASATETRSHTYSREAPLLDLIREASTLQFALASILFITGTMIVLQAALRRAVWWVYLITFFAAAVMLAVTLR